MNTRLQGNSDQTKRINITGNEEKNNTVWEWFDGDRAKGMPISGHIIQAEAIEVTKKLGKTENFLWVVG